MQFSLLTPKALSRRWRSFCCTLLLVLMAMPAISSCTNDEQAVYFSYQDLENGIWDRQYRHAFALDTIRESGRYRVEVCMRTMQVVQFQHVFVTVQQQVAGSRANRTDTIRLTLTDQLGNMAGRGLSLYNYSAELPRSITLRKGQSATLILNHIMRRQQLEGIKQIGLRVYKE